MFELLLPPALTHHEVTPKKQSLISQEGKSSSINEATSIVSRTNVIPECKLSEDYLLVISRKKELERQ
jgi:hypothetical protein